MDTIWSNTDFPYMCLRDEVRTQAFQRAIQKVVQKGDVVIDVGSGSGILAFFAASAGAKKVYAVEIEQSLVESLKKSVILNGFQSVIEVVEDDIMTTDMLPKSIDVVVEEIIETGLIDELQVPTFNRLRKKRVIDEHTKLIPNHYTTFLQLVYTDNNYYGYQIVAPKHEWPFYDFPGTGWCPTFIDSVSEKKKIVSADFSLEKINEDVATTITFKLPPGRIANAVRFSGIIKLADDTELGPTNGLNGDKIFSIDPIENVQEVTLKVSYKMGHGLGTLKIQKIS